MPSERRALIAQTYKAVAGAELKGKGRRPHRPVCTPTLGVGSNPGPCKRRIGEVPQAARIEKAGKKATRSQFSTAGTASAHRSIAAS
jgi:hypothetical protein